LCGFFDYCPIITHSYIRLTIPVALIYKNSLLYKFVLLVSVKQGDLYLILYVGFYENDFFQTVIFCLPVFSEAKGPGIK